MNHEGLKYVGSYYGFIGSRHSVKSGKIIPTSVLCSSELKEIEWKEWEIVELNEEGEEI